MKRTTLFIFTLSLIATAVWASGTGEAERYSYQSEPISWEPETSRWHEEINDQIIDLFAAEGIDSEYLNRDPGEIPADVRNSIDEIVVDQGGDLTSLIYPDLRALLSRGEVERAYVVLGTHRITASFAGYPEAQ